MPSGNRNRDHDLSGPESLRERVRQNRGDAVIKKKSRALGEDKNTTRPALPDSLPAAKPRFIESMKPKLLEDAAGAGRLDLRAEV